MNCVPRYREHLDATVTIDVMNGHFMEAWHPNWPEKYYVHYMDVVHNTTRWTYFSLKLRFGGSNLIGLPRTVIVPSSSW